MNNYVKIEPIQIGELKEKTANAIYWSINLERNITEAMAYCNLLYVDSNGTKDVGFSFQVNIPHSVLQQWGSSDDIIDDTVIAYSPLFVKSPNQD